MSGSIYVGTKAGTLQAPSSFEEYSGVILTIADDAEPYKAGNTAGRVLEVFCPWGNQKVADRILRRIRGYRYQPYTASGVDLNPAAQLGDGVTIENTYGGLYSIETQYGSVSSSDIAAPGEEELDHEFTYQPKSQREVRRRFRNVESQLSIQSGQIAAKVSQTGGNEDKSFEWRLTDDAWRLYSNGNLILRVNGSGLWVSGDGKFTGEVHAGNIKSGSTAGYIARSVLSSGVRTSLDWADTAGDMFQGMRAVGNILTGRLKVTGTVELFGYRWGVKTANVGGETIYYLGIIEEA